MLRKAQPLQGMVPGAVAIPHGPHSVLDESGDELIDRGGSEQMLIDGTKSNYFSQLDGYNSILLQIEKYDGEPLVEDYERPPFLATGIDSASTPVYNVEAAFASSER